MVNLFIAPMRSMSTAQQVEKALDRLRQRYGVSGGLTTEPQIIDVRLEPRVLLNTASLKSYNEDLNTLEVFAYAHDEVEKLSRQLLMDVANRLPGVLKRQYLDYNYNNIYLNNNILNDNILKNRTWIRTVLGSKLCVNSSLKN